MLANVTANTVECTLAQQISLLRGAQRLHVQRLDRGVGAQYLRCPDLCTQGSFLIRRQGGNPGVVLRRVISNSANHEDGMQL